MNHFKADTITIRLLSTMAESLRVAREKMIQHRWDCQAGEFAPDIAAKVANAILAEIFLPVQVLTPPVKRSPQTLENK